MKLAYKILPLIISYSNNEKEKQFKSPLEKQVKIKKNNNKDTIKFYL